MLRNAFPRLMVGLLLAGTAFSQQRVHAVMQPPSADIRVDSALVLIPVHVTNPLGASVISLEQADFALYEDDKPQTIALFAKDDAPISIGLLFDASGSMKNKRAKVAEAAAAFFRTANRDDEFFLIEFSETARIAVPFTGDTAELQSRIEHIRPYGQTALLDAFHVGLRQMKHARHLRKAFVVLSDGGDNWSRHTPRSIAAELLESDVQVYAMGIFDDQDTPKRKPREEKDGPQLLEELAEQTGGRMFSVGELNELPALATHISRELRTQYLLGYSPVRQNRDGKYHRVKVKLAVPNSRPDLHAYYRQGYYDLE